MSTAPPKIPENILKKRSAQARIAKSKKLQAIKNKKKNRATRKTIYKRAESYVVEYRNAEAQQVALRRQAKKVGNFYRAPEEKLAFVIRIRGIRQVPPKVKKILRLLRLRSINHGVFVRLNGASSKMLKLVEPYVTYGYPNLKSVRDLIYKRGYVGSDGDRVPIADNAVIEKHLGKYDIICVEDLIHEIFTVGPNFREANRFLMPFRLNSPLGGIRNKTSHFTEGGDAGNRGNKVNTLVHRMV